MRGSPGAYLLALFGVAAVALATTLWLSVLGLASSALLFLLPVLLVAARGGLGPGLLAALSGALAYNFFLLPPRFTLRIHGIDNLVSVLVLVIVALVTSRLATELKAREAEADARAQASAQAAAFTTQLTTGEPATAISAALDRLAARYGPMRLLVQDHLPDGEAGFSTLDLSAAAWAMHNGDTTGHGTQIMPAADWTFLPLSPRGQSGSDLLALARPVDGMTRAEAELSQLAALARLVGQARDRLALEEERHNRERLEDRDALRRTLLASLAHDFRTPLTVVTGELARLSASDDRAAAALGEAQRLDRMMDDLLGAARIESGALVPRHEAVDLVDVVADARAALGGAASGIKIISQVGHDLPLVDADPVLLRHILINLLDNATRHAATAVTIQARAIDGRIELHVEDDGSGVPPAERQRIFERFARIEGSDRHGGSGLGLAIVKGFADVMGLDVYVEESAGGGARFSLTMPIRAVAAL